MLREGGLEGGEAVCLPTGQCWGPSRPGAATAPHRGPQEEGEGMMINVNGRG